MSEQDKWFDGQLDLVPPVGDEQLAKVPPRRGVVLLEASGGEAILVLTAADIRARLRTRLGEPDENAGARRVDLRQITRRVLWRLAPSHFECDLKLLELASRTWPRRLADHVSWRPAWFVHADAEETYPHFQRTRDVFSRDGKYVGPFPDGRSAGRFVDALQDAFYLCRDFSSLRKAPAGSRCVYAQMGRCLCPCDGSMSMEDYRGVVARAMDFAAGSRDDFAGDLRARMKQAAGTLQFERAAELKARIKRLADFDAPAYRHVATAEEFRFVIVQSGFNRQQARTFLVNGPRVEEGKSLAYPPGKGELSRLVRAMNKISGAADPDDETGRYRMGLVAHYLLSSERRRGLMLRWRDDMDADDLARAIEGAADLLKLRAAKKRKKGKKAGR